MKKIVARNGIVIQRRDDGMFMLSDDEGIVLFNIPGEHRNSVKTFEFDDLLVTNRAMNSGDLAEITRVVPLIIQGSPKR